MNRELAPPPYTVCMPQTSGSTSGTSNQAPVADFTFVPTGLVVQFTDASSDADGTIASRAWDFGDGGSSTATNPSHTYALDGSYTAILTVTDNSGSQGVKSKTVTVSSGGTPTHNQDGTVNVSGTVQV